MEKKTILLELPCELIDNIDRLNKFEDRSEFINDLLQKQLNQKSNTTQTIPDEMTSRMGKLDRNPDLSGELNLMTKDGLSLGIFDINTIDGFKGLANKIHDFSNHPIVQMRVNRWR